MRILIVCGTQIGAKYEARRSCGPEVTMKMSHDIEVSKDNTTVIYTRVDSWNDIHRFAGQRFDMVLEDGSFNYRRSHDKGRMLNELREMVLR